MKQIWLHEILSWMKEHNVKKYWRKEILWTKLEIISKISSPINLEFSEQMTFLLTLNWIFKEFLQLVWFWVNNYDKNIERYKTDKNLELMKFFQFVSTIQCTYFNEVCETFN